MEDIRIRCNSMVDLSKFKVITNFITKLYPFFKIFLQKREREFEYKKNRKTKNGKCFPNLLIIVTFCKKKLNIVWILKCNLAKKMF